MDITTALFGLRRPEYPKSPEILQSALAWSLASSDSTPTSTSGNPVGYVYEQIKRSRSKHVEIRETRPRGTELTEWIRNCDVSGLTSDCALEQEAVFESLLDALESVTPAGAVGTTVKPLVPHAAFMQNRYGAHAKAGPPDYAAIIEGLFRAGCAEAQPPRAAARCWYSALRAGPNQPLFRFLDDALASIPGVEYPEIDGPDETPKENAIASWLTGAPTPYRWFARVWPTLCNERWRDELSYQRWTDWCSCVLRTAVGCGYLWEAYFFQQLGRTVLVRDDSYLPVKELLQAEDPTPLVTWSHRSFGLSVRDVNSKIRRSVIDGIEIRDFFGELIAEMYSHGSLTQEEIEKWKSDDGLYRFIDWAWKCVQGARRDRLASLYGSKPRRRHENTRETIMYLLQCRKETGQDADFYGPIRRRSGRYLVLDPASEWAVVVASLQAGKPRSATTLGDVRGALRELGIGVSRDVLVEHLEAAGLARSSHDADDAIIVWSGF